MSKNWSREEVDRIVRDYLEMLRLEQAGASYNKSERRRRLMQRIDRSPGSIELKHQNISAVMVDLGLPRIEGYLPAKNYQALLLEAVDACLNVDAELRDLLEGQNPIPGAPELVFDHSPPPARQRRPPVGDQVTRIIRKFDPAQRDARNRALGTAGEELVFESERRRLHNRGQPALSKQVRWIAQDDDGAGFDILSFSREGAVRWLEVKTTNGQAPTPFFLTANEERVSRENQDKFRLIRVYDFRKEPHAFCLRPPLEAQVDLTAHVYKAEIRQPSTA